MRVADRAEPATMLVLLEQLFYITLTMPDTHELDVDASFPHYCNQTGTIAVLMITKTGGEVLRPAQVVSSVLVGMAKVDQVDTGAIYLDLLRTLTGHSPLSPESLSPALQFLAVA